LSIPKSEPRTARANNILLELSEALLSGLFRLGAPHHLQEGEALFRGGDAGDGCYRIRSGLVKIVVASRQGEDRIISLQGPGAIVGELSMIDGLPRSASVVAITDCFLSFVSQDSFQKYSDANPELMTSLARILAGRIREADDALAATTFLSVKARLARALLNLAEYVGEQKGPGRIEFRHKISQSDLAAMAGVARENVSRAMSDWRKRDIVTRSLDYYCINDQTALAQEMESGR
jgi:CRP/FNR family transcriptional regulator, cyclic AMP receptor protein